MLLAAGVFGLGAPELLIILAVVVLIFGATRIAGLGASLGTGIREFRKNVKDEDGQDNDVVETTTTTVRTTPPPVAPLSDVETVSAVKCPSCGALNAATAKHCNECGAAIVVAPVSS